MSHVWKKSKTSNHSTEANMMINGQTMIGRLGGQLENQKSPKQSQNLTILITYINNKFFEKPQPRLVSQHLNCKIWVKSGTCRQLSAKINSQAPFYTNHWWTWVYSRMFHNFTFFEIKNAWGLIRSDLGHNEKIKIFSITRCFEGVPPPKVWCFWTWKKIFDNCDISLTKRDRE